MTVGKLIEKLKEYPENAQVCFNYPDNSEGSLVGSTCEADFISKFFYYEGMKQLDIDIS